MPLIATLVLFKLVKNCFLVTGTAANQEPTFTKHYFPAIIFSNQDSLQLLKQLESCFTSTINWNKYHSKITEQT